MSEEFPQTSEWNAYDLPAKYRTLDQARYAILPLPYERTTTYAKGCAAGPEAFLEASQQVELYDAELGSEAYRAGIYTAPPVRFDEESIDKCLNRIRDVTRAFLQRGKFVIAIGGEHTVTLPVVQAQCEFHPEIQVLQLDAHADLRQEFEGSPFNHACVMRRVREFAPHVGVGVRSLSAEEAAYIRREGIPIVTARELERGQRAPAEILEFLRPDKPVYITIDVDGFDPSEAPGVGTPEPGGLRWYTVVELLEQVARHRHVVGFDVVELRPISGSVVTEFLVARLVYRIIGLLEKYRSGTDISDR